MILGGGGGDGFNRSKSWNGIIHRLYVVIKCITKVCMLVMYVYVFISGTHILSYYTGH